MKKRWVRLIQNVFVSDFLQKYCPLVERLGFDENFLDITELVNDRILANTYDNEVKGHVYKEEDVKGNKHQFVLLKKHQLFQIYFKFSM